MNSERDTELERIRRKKLEEILAKAHGQSSKQETSNFPITVEDSNFDRLVHQHPLMVIDCWAPWCGPCLMVAPVMEELAKAYAGKVVFGKLNVDENPETAARFGVMSIPTLLIMKNGNEVDRIIGSAPKQVIEAKLRNYL